MCIYCKECLDLCLWSRFAGVYFERRVQISYYLQNLLRVQISFPVAEYRIASI
jgi:hypothetical protein